MSKKNNIFQNLIYSCLGIPKGFREKRIPAEVLKEWGHLQLYNPANQVELHLVDNKIDPAAGTPWMHLVTMARLQHDDPSASRRRALLKNFEQQIAKWDIMSTSLVSHRRSGDVVGAIGYILDIPPQNILSTNEEDVYFENHVGYRITPLGPALDEPVVNPYALAHSIKKRTQPLPKGGQYEFYGEANQFAKRLKAGEFLLSPSELEKLALKFAEKLSGKSRTHTEDHTEVVVIARSGLSLYQNMPPTGLIHVKGIYVVRPKLNEMVNMISRGNYNEYIDLAYQVSAVNNHVPILFV